MPSQTVTLSLSNSHYYCDRHGDDGNNAGNTSGTITLNVTVSGSNIICTVTADLDLDYYYEEPSGRPYFALYDVKSGGSSTWGGMNPYNGTNPYRQVRTISDVADGDDIVGTWTTTFRAVESSGDIVLNVEPGYPYSEQSPDPVRVSYSGATPATPPNGTITLPTSIVGGQAAQIGVTMSGGSGSLTGTLKRYYRPAGSFSYTGTVVRSGITSASATITDTIPANYGGGQVYYELTVSDGYESKQITSSTKSVISNSAPTVPGSITIPVTVSGGSSAEISWTGSTDPDGNLAGYLLEHSVDGGATWQTVYKGPNLSASETVIAGTQTIRWRVRAYDTYDVYSGAKTSSELNVINNNAPTVPASPITITPAALSTGGTAVISWGESTDPDGDDFEYSLERSVGNTVSYTEIYRGKNRYFSDTIGSWSTVTYRVRAIDARGAASGYRTASTKSVSSNTLPVITCSNADGADLGTKSAVFSFTYSVDDENESDTLTVTESIDGVVKKSFTATRDTSYTFNFKTTANADYWQSILNGEHTITISVTDSKATVSRTFHFLKSVDACLITLKNPISAATGKKIGTAVVSICGEIPAGGITAVQVCSDGDQDSPTWESCILASGDTGYAESGIGSRKKTANSGNNLNEELLGGHYLFIHKLTNAGGKFNFRVQVSQAGGEGGWIGSVQGTFTEESAS